MFTSKTLDVVHPGREGAFLEFSEAPDLVLEDADLLLSFLFFFFFLKFILFVLFLFFSLLFLRWDFSV